jgi:hypothetical protein
MTLPSNLRNSDVAILPTPLRCVVGGGWWGWDFGCGHFSRLRRVDRVGWRRARDEHEAIEEAAIGECAEAARARWDREK